MGEAEIDLVDAKIEASETSLEIVALMGFSRKKVLNLG